MSSAGVCGTGSYAGDVMLMLALFAAPLGLVFCIIAVIRVMGKPQ